MAELTPCPFCGLTIGPVLHARVGPWWAVVCNRCGAQGPAADTETAAEVAWNQHAPLGVLEPGQQSESQQTAMGDKNAG